MLLILVSSYGIAAFVTPHVTAQENTSLERALGYLRCVYNSTVGLMSEQPYRDNQGRELHWLNDDIFFYVALNSHGTQLGKLLANRIHKRIIEFAQMLNLPRCADGNLEYTRLFSLIR